MTNVNQGKYYIIQCGQHQIPTQMSFLPTVILGFREPLDLILDLNSVYQAPTEMRHRWTAVVLLDASATRPVDGFDG